MFDLKIDNLYKTYTTDGIKQDVLKGLNASFKSKEINFLCGPNGCGKTTLLKMISKIEYLDEGKIYLSENEIESKNKIECFDTAYIPQNVHKILSENIYIYELVKIFDQETIYQLTKELNIKWLTKYIRNKSKKLVSELSEGQKQFLITLILISHEKQVILLDEIFSNIDNDAKNKFWDYIRVVLKKESVTSIIVTHDYRFAYDNADKIFVMKNGKIYQSIAPKKFDYESVLKAIFI